MPLRPALRAALVVSGLTVTAGCGGTATLREESGTGTSGSTTTGSSSETATNGREPCEPGAEPTDEACCDASGGRAWDAASGQCVWIAVPGPFVPPAMIG